MTYTRLTPFAVCAVLLCGSAVESARSQGASSAPDASAAPVLVPHASWTCGLPDGIPPPERGTLIFEAAIPLDRTLDVGRTPYGDRTVAVGKEGVLSGAKLSGTVATGGLDFALTLPNGVIEIEQVLVFRASDGSYIYVRTAGTGADAGDVRVVMDFEAPTASAFAWLNTGTYVARRIVNAAAGTMTLRVYDVSGAAPTAGAKDVIRITKPAGVPAQPWDYRKADPSEKQGPVLITESVTLAPSQRVGPSKRGNRNIIPITGGDVKGRFTARVLPGGADYQNLANPATIDARYLWETNDGHIIIVRNGGSFGSLVPTFEVPTDSPYAYLNTGSYLSSNPGMAPGGVSITIYESTR
jgi:hypothetical protein